MVADRRVALSRLRLARVSWGGRLLVVPAGALAAVGLSPSDTTARRLVRVLGGRDVLQGLLTTDRRRAELGFAVDALHALSMIGVALSASDGRRRLALTSAAVASGFGAAGWAVTHGEGEPSERDSRRGRTRRVRGKPQNPSALARCAARLLRTRWLVRAPVWLYRARLGFLFGSRLLMLEHTGRRTGIPRYVVLEVIEQRAPGTYVVVSGFGDRAQWFRNVQANPAVRISVSSRPPAQARARLLRPDETARALTAYRSAHPRAWASLRPVLEETLGAPVGEAETDLPMIGFTLEDR